MSAQTVEVAEGTINLFSGTWFCTEHAQTMRVGRECAFCVSDLLTPAQFDKWLDENSA